MATVLHTHQTKCLLLPQNVEFEFNVQHDCPLAHCSATGKRTRQQERIVSEDILDDAIEHQKNIDQWIINTLSLHNGHLLRLRIRPELISPVRIIPVDERQRQHHEVASGLQRVQEEKRKNLAGKRAAKKASAMVDSKGGAPTTGSKSAPDWPEPMEVDAEVA